MATASSPYFVVQWSLNGKPISKHLDVEVITGMLLLVVRERNLSPTLFLQIVPIIRIFVSIRSSLSIGASSLARTHNGLPQSLRRCSRRVLSEQSDMTGC